MTSKPSKGRPGACWRKRGRVSLKRTSPKQLLRASQGSPGSQGSQGSQGRVCAPESIQIGASQLPGRDCLSLLNLKEPYDIFPLSTGCFPRPQIYVEEHPAPALYLPFQLDFQSVPLAQEETIDFLLGGLGARASSEQVVDLAWGPLGLPFWAVPLWFLLSHEKCLLSLLTAPGIPRFAGPSPKEEGDSKKRPLTHIRR